MPFMCISVIEGEGTVCADGGNGVGIGFASTHILLHLRLLQPALYG